LWFFEFALVDQLIVKSNILGISAFGFPAFKPGNGFYFFRFWFILILGTQACFTCFPQKSKQKTLDCPPVPFGRAPFAFYGSAKANW
jgi:hypothetical protein